MSERNMVVGGEPGGGKSVALSMLVAAAALDPYAHLTLFDGKLVELSMWRGCADHFVGTDLQKALEVLKELRSDMEERYRYLMDSGRRKIGREDGDRFPLRLVVIDLCRGRDYADTAERRGPNGLMVAGFWRWRTSE